MWDLVLSRDPQQRHLFMADGRNIQVQTLLRETGEVVGTLCRPGRCAGKFHGAHDLAVDSQGKLCAGEVETGKRAQKFVTQPRRIRSRLRGNAGRVVVDADPRLHLRQALSDGWRNPMDEVQRGGRVSHPQRPQRPQRDTACAIAEVRSTVCRSVKIKRQLLAQWRRNLVAADGDPAQLLLVFKQTG